MKKLLFIFILLTTCYALLATTATAKTTPTPTITKSEQQLNEIKERIASRVAELKLVEKRGVIGTVTDISDTQITISDSEDNKRFIDVDEITKFSSSSARGSFGISDITRGSKLGILGLYNKQSRRILARFIDVLNLSKVVYGAVESIDSENFSLKVVTANKEELTVDVEKLTKTSSYSKDSGLIKSGFSKIKESERIIAVGFADIKDKNRVIASRITYFSDLPKDPKIILSEKSLKLQETIIPSTGSGKKLTPITR